MRTVRDNRKRPLSGIRSPRRSTAQTPGGRIGREVFTGRHNEADRGAVAVERQGRPGGRSPAGLLQVCCTAGAFRQFCSSGREAASPEAVAAGPGFDARARQPSPDGSAWRPAKPTGVRAVLRRRLLAAFGFLKASRFGASRRPRPQRAETVPARSSAATTVSAEGRVSTFL